MSALFDGWFGFIFWAAAYRELNYGKLWKNQPLSRKLETAFNVFLFVSAMRSATLDHVLTYDLSPPSSSNAEHCPA